MEGHHEFIRECHRLAIEAGKAGDEPFGAMWCATVRSSYER